MSITQDHLERLYTAEVVDQDGDTVGKVGQVYLDDQTGAPAWITVKTGFFGSSETFVPLDAADIEQDRVRVPYDRSYIKAAPTMEADRHLSDSEQDELYRYYGLQGTPQAYGETDQAPVVDRDRDDDAGRMTLHEERVDVGTERVQTGRIRLRKHVVREQETVTVPVEREEIEVVREPVAPGETTGRTLGEDEIDVPVHEDRVVVDKDVVATEQVGVDRHVVQEDRAVTTDVSREEVDVVEDGTPSRL